MEGPFINPEKKGAHPEHLVRRLNGGGLQALEQCYGKDLSNVSMVTLAPELENADEVVTHLHGRGIIVSIGHTRCDLSHAEHAIRKGAASVTHLFNAMTAFHHRSGFRVGG